MCQGNIDKPYAKNAGPKGVGQQTNINVLAGLRPSCLLKTQRDQCKVDGFSGIHFRQFVVNEYVKVEYFVFFVKLSTTAPLSILRKARRMVLKRLK